MRKSAHVVLTICMIDVKPKPGLPSEIQDRIIDFLHDSKSTLLACALVCRAWVPTSRFHGEILVTATNVDVITETLKEPNCTIRSCKCLILRWYTDIRTAMRIMGRLEDLSTLLTPHSLLLRDWPILDLQTLTKFTLFPSIKYLSLKNSPLSSLNYLDGMLTNFPNIHELSMTQCYLYAPPHVGCVLFTSRPLRSLELIGPKASGLLPYFIKGRIFPTKYFSMDSLGHDDISMIGEYFSMCGNALEEIRVGFIPDDTRAAVLGTYVHTHNLTAF